MRSGIEPELEELLGFTWELTHYLDIRSPWRTGIFPIEEGKFPNTSMRILSFDAVVPVSDVVVACSYSIFSAWWIIPPRCVCRASWIRRAPDWHVNGTGELCWVYAPYWQHVLQGIARELDRSVARQTAAYWFAEKSVDLINKHLQADRLLLKEWPKQWPEWAHGDGARQQYDQIKLHGQIERDIHGLLTARAREHRSSEYSD
jgi:hypothetical protein